MANKNEPKKSKYFRDASDKPKSKYIKSEGTVTKSKYIKSDEDRENEKKKATAEEIKKAKKSYSRSTSQHRDASQTNLKNRLKAQEAEARANGSDLDEIKLPEEITSLDEAAQSKGDHTAIFTNEKADKSAYRHYKEAEETPDDSRRATQIVRTALIVLAMLAIALFLNFMTVHFDFMPSFISVEFSAIPEFIVAIAYGPVFGLAIALAKNVIHMLMNQPSFISEVHNFMIDGVFMFVGGWIYTRRMFNFKTSKKSGSDSRSKKHRSSSHKEGSRDRRTRRILSAGFIATCVTSFVCFFTTRYFAYPLLIRMFSDRGYSDVEMLFAYQESLDKINAQLPDALSGIITEIDSFSKAILLYNIPLTFVKFLFITVFAALVYPPISDFLHYRLRHKSKHRSSSKHSSSSKHRSNSKHSR